MRLAWLVICNSATIVDKERRYMECCTDGIYFVDAEQDTREEISQDPPNNLSQGIH